MKPSLSFSFALGMCVIGIIACGGVGTGLGDGGGGDSGDDASADSSDGAATDSGNNDAPACPDESGRYSVAFSGQGCGNISTQATICIQETSCTITLITGVSSGGSNEVSGTTPIVSDGSFSSAAIKEGSQNRTGCVGAWDKGSSTLTIDCGGTATSQSCRATLVRTAGKCN